MGDTSIREDLTPEERALSLEPTIDPGFVHKRKIQTILGPEGMRVIDDLIARIPPVPDWQREVRIDHIYTDVLLEFCKIHHIKSLAEGLSSRRGHMICSTEELAPCENLYDVERAVSLRVPPGERDLRVEFHYSTALIRSDTLRSRLLQGTVVSLVADVYSVTEDLAVFEPMLIGFPWLRSNHPQWQDKLMWWSYQFFENFVEDFDEFSKVREYEKPKDFTPMKYVSERGFKRALAQILGDPAHKDWGGETSDYFTSNLHLKGHRITGAFLLKGPARFTPMNLNHLGKNNDQIVRLAQDPADVLIVQHCHEILPPVRSTLRAFAVQPHRARRYCLIDGRDSLWLLQAYGLYESAVAWSRTGE